jgi:hypothetical protein
VAKIAFAGQYAASDFHVTSDATGHVLITDPGVPFGGGATLGFAADGNQHGGTLPITPGTAATAALFGHYIAGSLLAGGRRVWRRPHGRGRSISRPATAFDAASRLTRANKPQRKAQGCSLTRADTAHAQKNGASCVAMVAVLPGIA